MLSASGRDDELVNVIRRIPGVVDARWAYEDEADWPDEFADENELEFVVTTNDSGWLAMYIVETTLRLRVGPYDRVGVGNEPVIGNGTFVLRFDADGISAEVFEAGYRRSGVAGTEADE